MVTYTSFNMQEDAEINIKFIELVRNHPCLYDHTLSDYSNRNKQDKIWGQIALQLNDTVSACRDRWRNIRWRYVKQFNKLPSGSGAKPKKPYYLADHLNFLDTFIKSRPPTGNLLVNSPPNIVEEHSNSAQGVSDIEEESLTDSRGIEEAGRSSINTTHTDTSAPSTPEPGARASTVSVQRRLRNKNSSLDDLNRAVLDYFEKKKTRLDIAPTVTDPDEAFLKSILPDMKKMSDINKRNFKVAVMQLAGQFLNEPVTIPPPLPVPPVANMTSTSSTQLSHSQFLLPQYSPITPVNQSTYCPAASENNHYSLDDYIHEL